MRVSSSSRAAIAASASTARSAKLRSASSFSPDAVCAASRSRSTPPFASSTLRTRSGAISFGLGEKPPVVTSRSRSAVYGASSIDGSGIITFHVAVDASTVAALPAFARL